MGTSDSCKDANQRYNDEFASFRVLKVRRVNIMPDMVEIFKDESVMASVSKSRGLRVESKCRDSRVIVESKSRESRVKKSRVESKKVES